ncbi:MAG: hypothetical protein ACK4TJ_01650 [Tabrizicola sp.]
MDNPHHRTRVIVHGRERISARVLAGRRAADVAAALAVSIRTVRKWLARSIVARWLRREGLGRLARIDPPEPVRRYQRARARVG